MSTKRNRDPNFPKMLYRADGAEVKTLIVTSDASLEAAKAEGWGDHATAKAAAAKAPKPAPVAAPANTTKETLDLINKLDAAQKASAGKDEMIAAKDGVIQAQGDRIVALQNFIEAIRDDENCPPPLKAAIADLLGEGEEAQAKAKPKKK